MKKNLVIVESPAKAKTIEKFLGNDFQVESCYGHIADLPSKDLGIDIEKNFEPSYKVSPDKVDVVKKLRKLAKGSETVWLASDEDREGEAIAWHLNEQLKLTDEKTKRIVFHEITKNAILKAIENPRKINQSLVNAQQARRILDRIVGYKLSPVLWKKVKGGLSAGRVQSVSVRLVVEKERDIQNFEPTFSYKVVALFITEDGREFKSALSKSFTSEKEANAFLELCKNAAFKIKSVQKKPFKKHPAAPFTTSTLQQEASRKLNFSVAKTMQVAQRLYESGMITYMRTDSVNLSDEARKNAQKQIITQYGKEYSNPRNYNTKSKGAQEAHEAIRPTQLETQNISSDFDQERLYSLIWKRTLSSQMSEAELERTTLKVEVSGSEYTFSTSGEVIKFDGFLKVYMEGTDDEDVEQTANILPKVAEGDGVTYNQITAVQKYTRAPYRYSDASLVKKLEELGIGRPSTYAPTISTIQKRGYVIKGAIEGEMRGYTQLSLSKEGTIISNQLSEKVGFEKNKFYPTDIGKIVNDFLVSNFSEILDYGFTANVESKFDSIAQGGDDWVTIISEFYQKFQPIVKEVEENSERARGERLLGIEKETGKNVYVRLGRYGAMVQIGEAEDEEKPRFASLLAHQTIEKVTLEEVLPLFEYPKNLGTYKDKEIILANGRFGPFLKHDDKNISLPKGEDMNLVTLEGAIEFVKEREAIDKPIGYVEELPVQRGVGRFGPYIKWNSIFINVSKKYDFDALSQEDIEQLVEDKKRKEAEKVIHHWEKEGIRVEKYRWGRHHVIKGTQKVELSKDKEVVDMTLEQAEAILAKNKPASKKKRAAKK